MKRWFLSVLTAALALAIPMPASRAESAADATADPASQQVQLFYDGLLDSMKHAQQLGLKGRFDKLKPVVERA